MKTDPINFLNSSRFDILAKYIYANFLEKNIDSTFGLDLYKEHLKVWNDCRHGDGKDGLQIYLDTFHELLSSIKEKGFDPDESLINSTEELKLLNGGHRVASCLLNNEEICYEIGGSGQTNVNYEYFKNKGNFVPGGLSEKWCDAIATEYCKLKPNTFIATIFPSAIGKAARSREVPRAIWEVEQVIKEKSDIFYKKIVNLYNYGPLNLMKEMYYGEAWGGDRQKNFPGLRSKVNLCFRSSSPIIIYVITTKQKEDPRYIKERVRNIFKIGNHSIHINDTKEETLRLSRCLLNNNSIHFINNATPAYFNNFENYISFFRGYIQDNELDIEDYCVTASSTLSRYGLREGNDLDYLHRGQEIHGHDMIHSHNSYAVGRYHTSVDDVIYNPLNHFYFNDVKYASLDVIKKLKEKRMEEKDKKDLRLIEETLYPT